MEDFHNQGKWTESESDSDSKTAEAAEGPSAEVHRRSLAPENVGLSKKKRKLSLTILKKAATICPYPIENNYGNPPFAWELSASTY